MKASLCRPVTSGWVPQGEVERHRADDVGRSPESGVVLVLSLVGPNVADSTLPHDKFNESQCSGDCDERSVVFLTEEGIDAA